MSTQEQFLRIKNAAEQGDASAQRHLGGLYQHGVGVPRNNAEAVRWYRKATEQGYAPGQTALGSMYEYGWGVNKDYAEAIKWYRKAIEQEDASAKWNLGRMYKEGKGVNKDYAEAVKWYRKAAEQGYTFAQEDLAGMYEQGKGVDQDIVEAVKWYRKAAEQGYFPATSHLGEMYENGWGVDQDNAEAIEWYRKAAEQGDEEAERNLARVINKGIVSDEPTDDVQSVSVHQGRNGHRPLISSPRKVTASSREMREVEECKPILEACTPLVYRHNAFRTTGLPVDATTRDIKHRIDDLKAAEEMGVAGDEYSHAFALNPPPSLDLIREAAQRLQNPQRRIIDEFFWFWPTEWGKGESDPALLALCNNGKNTAFKIWSRAISNNGEPASITAKHNLAVLYHLIALDLENVALERDLNEELLAKLSNYWRICFKWWEELTSDEAFWSLVTARIRMLDDPQLTTGFARRMRATLPEALGTINAMLAVSFAEKDKLPRAANHIAYMKETHPWQDNAPKILGTVTEPLKMRVRTAIDNARAGTEREPGKGARCAEELLQAVKEPLRIIQTILPPSETEMVDLLNSVADAALKCQIAYGKNTEDWKTCVDGLDLADNYACTQEIKIKIAETRSIFADNQLFSQYFEPLEKKIQEIETKPALAEKIHAAETDLLSSLSAIEHAPGMSAKVYEACADLVAGYVRGLSVAAVNEQSDLGTAMRTLNLAISLARGSELRNQLREDEEKIAELKFSYDLKTLVEGGGSADDKLPQIVKVINARLEKLSAGKKRDEALEISAYALRTFAIKLCNDEHKYSEGEAAIKMAIDYAKLMVNRNNEMMPMLAKDAATIWTNSVWMIEKNLERARYKWCFIASAVYGSPDDSAVVALRSFRDSVLMPYIIGRGFVAVYYRIGPYFADRVASSPFLKAYCRRLLNRLVALIRCYLPVNDSFPSKHL